MTGTSRHLLLGGLIAMLAWLPHAASAQTTIDVQSRFPPNNQADAPPGGAHPVGGVANAFVKLANEELASAGIQFVLHASGAIDPADAADARPRIVTIGKFGNLHKAVQAGAAGGGLNAALDIAINNGHQFGELFVAGLPFGMAPDEYMAYLYAGGGLVLQQQLYDEVFNGKVVVIPVGITTAQGAGWFPRPLPDPDSPGRKSVRTETQFDPPSNKDVKAMRELCETPMIVRWAEPGAGVWREACRMAGVEEVAVIDPGVRCQKAFDVCPGPDNPIVFEPQVLTFGGFTPGILPQLMLNTGNIDAHEFNMPSDDIQFNKRALGLESIPNDQADISPVVAKAPFQYGSSWHQPLSYIELLINRDFWNTLTDTQRMAIQTVARSSVLFNYTARLNLQGDAMKKLAASGAVHLAWPRGLLRVLRAATDPFLDAKADGLADPANPGSDNGAYRRAVDSQRAYMQKQRAYWDFGDINRGLNRTPTAP